MSMTAGEGEGGAGIMDDASCSSEAEAITAAAARDCAGSLVERCAGDGDCSCGGVNPGWGVEWSELSERPLLLCVKRHVHDWTHATHPDDTGEAMASSRAADTGDSCNKE